MSGVVENVNNRINVREFPIEIVWIGKRGEVGMNIGDKYAQISEPKMRSLENGIVYIGAFCLLANESWAWEDHISCDVPGMGTRRGYTDDPRLVDIGKKVFTGESLKLKPGTIIPPLEKE
jgi:hypothetical protein